LILNLKHEYITVSKVCIRINSCRFSLCDSIKNIKMNSTFFRVCPLVKLETLLKIETFKTNKQKFKRIQETGTFVEQLYLQILTKSQQ